MQKKFLIILSGVICLALHASASTAAAPTLPSCSEYKNDCYRQVQSWHMEADCNKSKRGNFLETITVNAKLTAAGKELITKNYDACCSQLPTFPPDIDKMVECYCEDGTNLLRQAGLCIGQ